MNYDNCESALRMVYTSLNNKNLKDIETEMQLITHVANAIRREKENIDFEIHFQKYREENKVGH